MTLNSTKKRTALNVLPAGRYRELIDSLDLWVEDRRSRDTLVDALADGRKIDFEEVLGPVRPRVGIHRTEGIGEGEKVTDTEAAERIRRRLCQEFKEHGSEASLHIDALPAEAGVPADLCCSVVATLLKGGDLQLRQIGPDRIALGLSWQRTCG